jgi:hypothetical protein
MIFNKLTTSDRDAIICGRSVKDQVMSNDLFNYVCRNADSFDRVIFVHRHMDDIVYKDVLKQIFPEIELLFCDPENIPQFENEKKILFIFDSCEFDQWFRISNMQCIYLVHGFSELDIITRLLADKIFVYDNITLKRVCKWAEQWGKENIYDETNEVLEE